MSTSLIRICKSRRCYFLVCIFATSLLLLSFARNKEMLNEYLMFANPEKVTHSKTYKTCSRDDIKRKSTDTLRCQLLFKANTHEVSKAKSFTANYTQIVQSEKQYIQQAAMCNKFKEDRCYWTGRVSQIEEEVPVAYSILTYVDFEQSERLLRAIYRPNNHYCIHVDGKASSTFRQAWSAVAACFNNVFLVKSINVTRGDASNLHATLNCARELFKRKSWRYFINLTGQEFPLKTNFEIANILKVFNGANDVPGDYRA